MVTINDLISDRVKISTTIDNINDILDLYSSGKVYHFDPERIKDSLEESDYETFKFLYMYPLHESGEHKRLSFEAYVDSFYGNNKDFKYKSVDELEDMLSRLLSLGSILEEDWHHQRNAGRLKILAELETLDDFFSKHLSEKFENISASNYLVNCDYFVSKQSEARQLFMKYVAVTPDADKEYEMFDYDHFYAALDERRKEETFNQEALIIYLESFYGHLTDAGYDVSDLIKAASKNKCLIEIPRYFISDFHLAIDLLKINSLPDLYIMPVSTLPQAHFGNSVSLEDVSKEQLEILVKLYADKTVNNLFEAKEIALNL